MSRLNIVCIDASKFSENAFFWYVENYHRDGDTVGLLHVHQMPAYPVSYGLIGYEGGVTDVLSKSYYNDIKNSLRDAKALLLKYKEICDKKGFKSNSFLQNFNESAGHTICELLEQTEASAVFIGQRGLGTISRMIVGSTSDYVIHHAHIPVTVIPTASKEE